MKCIKICFIMLMMLVITNIYAHAWLYLNDTKDGFPEPEKTQIDSLVTSGAADFINSYSEVLLLLKEYEIPQDAVFNINTALSKAESAFKKLETARQKYYEAVVLSERCVYEEPYKKKLDTFDYNSCVTKEKLNSAIANDVMYHLKKGDVQGLYKKNLGKIDEILELSKTIRADLYANTKPDIPQCWKLLQKYSETLLFGNYATVFSQKAFK